MIVEWKEAVTYPLLDNVDSSFPIEELRIIEKSYRGKVFFTYRNFWGVPKFVVLLDNREIVTVRCDQCLFVEE